MIRSPYDSPLKSGTWPAAPRQPRYELRVWLITAICACILVIATALAVFWYRGGP